MQLVETTGDRAMFRAKKVETPVRVIPVELDKSGTQWVYVKPCESCGERHVHGAGSGLGYRVSHCNQDPHTVLLVSDDEPGNAS
jgi:hypothetical protein